MAGESRAEREGKSRGKKRRSRENAKVNWQRGRFRRTGLYSLPRFLSSLFKSYLHIISSAWNSLDGVYEEKEMQPFKIANLDSSSINSYQVFSRLPVENNRFLLGNLKILEIRICRAIGFDVPDFEEVRISHSHRACSRSCILC